MRRIVPAFKQPEAVEDNGEKAKQEEQIRCPRCGAPMVKRTAKREKMRGRNFMVVPVSHNAGALSILYNKVDRL